MTNPSDADADALLLASRVDPALLEQRLSKEQAKEVAVKQGKRRFFFADKKFSLRSLFRNGLQLLGLLTRGRSNALQLQVTYNDIGVSNLPAEFENFRVLHLSDLHLDANEGLPSTLAETVAGLECDLCVISGDFRARSFGPIENCIAQLREVVPHIEVDIYAALGNHDSITMVPAIEAMGIRLLLNESVTIERNGEQLFLVGVDDPHYFKSDDLTRASADVPADACSILLVHSPEIIEQAHRLGFNAYLCGHTHGGQICLPGGMPLMSNARASWRFSSGRWNFRGMPGYTSRGSGVSIVDARFNCPPEVTIHRFYRA